MGNLFNHIDTKICRECGEEKPFEAFPIKRKKGVSYLYGKCKVCFGAQRWKNMSDEARERKRERERKAIKEGRSKERMRRSNKARLDRNREQWISLNIGAMCIVQWHKCEKCGREQYLKNKEIDGAKCNRCKRTRFFTGELPIKDSICPKCGIVHKGKTKSKMCVQCAVASHKASIKAMRKAKGGRERNILDRARRHGVYIGKVSKIKVYRRDKWRCYLCGIKVLISNTYRPDQATIDHVIPISIGGSHTYDNVRTCCHACNSNKLTSINDGVQIGLFCSIGGAEGERRVAGH